MVTETISLYNFVVDGATISLLFGIFYRLGATKVTLDHLHKRLTKLEQIHG